MPSSRGRAATNASTVTSGDAPGQPTIMSAPTAVAAAAPGADRGVGEHARRADPVAGEGEPGHTGDVDTRATSGARVATRAWSPRPSSAARSGRRRRDHATPAGAGRAPPRAGRGGRAAPHRVAGSAPTCTTAPPSGAQRGDRARHVEVDRLVDAEQVREPRRGQRAQRDVEVGHAHGHGCVGGGADGDRGRTVEQTGRATWVADGDDGRDGRQDAARPRGARRARGRRARRRSPASRSGRCRRAGARPRRGRRPDCSSHRAGTARRAPPRAAGSRRRRRP